MSSGNNNVNERMQFAFDLNLEAVGDGNCDSPDNSDLCTICLEPLLVNTDRTVVTLMCNHKFHIDCIGSAFNARNSMQCPNCMRIEPGQWRFSTCNHQNFDWRDEDWFSGGEDPGFFNAMHMGMELCPYAHLSRELYHYEGPNSGHNTEQCLFIEYSFTLPRYPTAAAGDTRGSDSRYTEPEPIPYTQQVFWSVAGPGVFRGRHYLAHPTLYHDLSSRVTLPYPNRSTMQPNRMDPSTSSPVSRGSVFSTMTVREQLATTLLPDSWSNIIGLMNFLINGSSHRSNVWYAESLFDLAQQFQMDRELYSMVFVDDGFGSGSRGGGGRGGGGGNDRDGGGGSGGSGHVFQSGGEQLGGGIGDSLSTTFGLDQQVYNNGLNHSNVQEAEPFIDLVQHFQMDRELLINMIRDGGGNENGSRGGGNQNRGRGRRGSVRGGRRGGGGGNGRRGDGGGSRGGGNGNGYGISHGGRN
ncbi:unnamed protein product [Microthlaspi erraticum]|uniref:RING-type domain-containing protein n=1 Tax=Microthlaspi erraticum TaxID=1685480 RepID=A0A6D2KZ70_9BRAS|nr:unnamed protein product [Microthlaspi erraticum]